MICAKCGREIFDDSKFCTYCGASVELTPAEEPEIPQEPETPKEPDAIQKPDAFQEPTALSESEISQGTKASQDAKEVGETEPSSTSSQSAPEPSVSFPPPNAPSPGATAPGISPQSAPPPDVPSQGVPPQGMSPQEMPVQGMPPQGAPQPGMPPQSVSPQGMPPQGVPPQGVPPQAPKKKNTAVIVVVVIVAVLLCCATVSLIGFLGFREALTGPATGYGVLLDNDLARVTIDVGEGENLEYADWYEIPCTFENKTNKRLGVTFSADTTVDGLGVDSFSIFLYPEAGSDVEFAANRTSEGLLVFIPAPYSHSLYNLEGTLTIYDGDTYETLGKYPFRVEEL